MKTEQKEKAPASCSDSHSKSELKSRLRHVIGDESVSSFSRRVGITESLMRKYLNGSSPSAKNLTLIAQAGGVTVDWLATGNGIKSAEELRRLAHAQQDDASQDERDDFARRYGRRLEKVEILLRMMPEAERERSINEFLSRVQELKEAHDLRTAVAELRAALQKSA